MNVTITLNGRSLTVPQGLTILQVARQHDVYIPTLCDYPGLPPHGSCRMCIVEIEGKAVTPTACTTPVEAGMCIHTDSSKVRALRVELLQMLLADHPSSCLFCSEKSHCDECMVTLRKAGVTTGCRSCPKDEQCELQDMVARVLFASPSAGTDRPAEVWQSYPPRYRMLPVRKDDPFFDRDYNLCVLCGRCIRTCGELHFNNALAYTRRGAATVVGTAFDRTQIEAGCSFCGACVAACPTGALTEKTRKWDGAPQAEVTSACPLCSAACDLRLLVQNGRVMGSLPVDGSDGLCVRGRFGVCELLNHPTRLLHPQAGNLDISWDEALARAATALRACPPEQFALVISASSGTEDLYLAQKFVRSLSSAARVYAPDLDAYGDDPGQLVELVRQAQPLSVLDEASEILCLGLDGNYAQSVVEVKLHRAKARGARLVTVYSGEHRLGRYADEKNLYLAPFEREIEEKNPPLPPLDKGGEEQNPALLTPLTSSPSGARSAGGRGDSAGCVIILGPDALTSPQRGEIFRAVQTRLADGARLVLLSDHANLAAALRLGIQPASALPPDVNLLYLIGENLPVALPGSPFILYQHIYPPSSERRANLILPQAAFSESAASLVDSTGQTRSLRPAVPPACESRPAWQVLSSLAQALGLPGFDYPDLAALQAEIAREMPALAPALPRPAGQPFTWQNPLLAREPAYLGFPLSHWVEGLKVLVPPSPAPIRAGEDN